MKNFEVINKALMDCDLSDKAFRMFFLITNTMNINKTDQLEVFNGFLMDKLNLSERQVQRLTKEIVEKGYLCLTKTKKGNVYKICTKEEEKLKKELKKKKNIGNYKDLSRKESYHKDLTHPNWYKKKNEILERDKHQCQLCGSKDNLHVHHLKYVDGRHAWEYPNKNLITLCQDCHEKVHADKNNPLNPYNKPITNKC